MQAAPIHRAVPRFLLDPAGVATCALFRLVHAAIAA